MGKGDKRSRRGKIFAGSFGKSRPKNKNKADGGGSNRKESAQKSEE